MYGGVILSFKQTPVFYRPPQQHLSRWTVQYRLTNPGRFPVCGTLVVEATSEGEARAIVAERKFGQGTLSFDRVVEQAG